MFILAVFCYCESAHMEVWEVVGSQYDAGFMLFNAPTDVNSFISNTEEEEVKYTQHIWDLKEIQQALFIPHFLVRWHLHNHLALTNPGTYIKNLAPTLPTIQFACQQFSQRFGCVNVCSCYPPADMQISYRGLLNSQTPHPSSAPRDLQTDFDVWSLRFLAL